MKNEAREAVANLRESIDRLVMFCGLDLREGLETGTDWREFVMASTPESMIRELESITELVDEMDKQIDILEAIDDNDIMEHAYSQTKDWEPGEVYDLYPVEDEVQPEDC